MSSLTFESLCCKDTSGYWMCPPSGYFRWLLWNDFLMDGSRNINHDIIRFLAFSYACFRSHFYVRFHFLSSAKT